MPWPCWDKKWSVLGWGNTISLPVSVLLLPFEESVFTGARRVSQASWGPSLPQSCICLPCECSNNRQAPCQGMVYYGKESLLLLLDIFNPKRERSQHFLSLSRTIYQHPVLHSCKFHMYPITFKNDQIYFSLKQFLKLIFLSYTGWFGWFLLFNCWRLLKNKVRNIYEWI